MLAWLWQETRDERDQDNRQIAQSGSTKQESKSITTRAQSTHRALPHALLVPLTSCTTVSLHRTTHLVTERPRIVSSVLQSVSDESDFFLAAGANSSLLCTLIEIDEDASSETSDALLLPAVAEIAGPLDPTTGVLSPRPDLSVLALIGEDRYDCLRCPKPHLIGH